jgi:hypothetical protein
MNLFRSEEHVRNWSGFKAGTEEGMNKLSELAELLSGNFSTKRLDSDYYSNMQDYMMEFIGSMKDMGSFYQMPEQ